MILHIYNGNAVGSKEINGMGHVSVNFFIYGLAQHLVVYYNVMCVNNTFYIL